MTGLKKTLQSYLASHKGTITSIAGVVMTAFFGALYAQSQAGHKLDLLPAAAATLTAVFGVLAGMGKAPDTPATDAPNKPPMPMEATPKQVEATGGNPNGGTL